MSNNIENIEIIKNLLIENHIKKIVISPGGTNIAMVKAVQDDDRFECYSVVDERSAAYFAIGLYLQTGEVVALCCTSAQATRNYIPGLTEAYYKRVPLLVISMQKHPRFTYQEYMQAPDQSSMPKDCVKASYTLPYIADHNDEFHCVALVNKAIQEVTHYGYGPVQICVPWLDFPLGESVPKMRTVHRYTCEESWDVQIAEKKILIVIGEHRPFDDDFVRLINTFCERYGAVVYANLLSNFHSKYCVASNLLMSTMTPEEFNALRPDVFITIGGQTGDYPLYRMLSNPHFSDMEHWRVAIDGDCIDTYDKLTKIFECNESLFFEKMIAKTNSVVNLQYLRKWKTLDEKMNTNIEVPLSNLAIAQKMSKVMPKNSNVQLAILNSLRVWSLFAFDSSIRFFSNVGAFGIDGGMSTAIGQSFATQNMCFMVTGDLAFLYDINSLSIRGIKNNLRVILINNNGGFEFKLGVGHDSNIDRYIAAAGHFKTAKGWARDCGFEYLPVKTSHELDMAIPTLVGESAKPIIMEVFVSDDDEYEAYHKLIGKNSRFTCKQKIKKQIKMVYKALRMSR